MLNVSEFRRLLFSGHGRALVFLLEHGSAGLEETILEACVRDTAFNRQCEGSREVYLVDLIEISGLRDFLLPRLFAALRASDPHVDYGYDHSHMLGLVAALARKGDTEARTLVYETFLRNCARRSWVGADDIVELDPASGYRYVLEQIGKHELSGKGNEWKAPSLHRLAAELIGAAAAQEILQDTARQVPGLLKFTCDLDRFDFESDGVPKGKPEVHVPYDDYRTQLQNVPPGTDGPLPALEPGLTPSPSVWGRWASPEDLKRAAADLVAATHPRVLWRYLRIFRDVPFPGTPDHVIRLLNHRDPVIIRAAWSVLQNLSHPGVRSVALAHLNSANWSSFALELLSSNFEPGDAARIDEVLRSASPGEDFHGRAQGALTVIKQQEDNWNSVLLRIYNVTPCSLCRRRAVMMMDEDDLLTPELLRECCLDCVEQVRQLAKEAGKQ